MELIASHTLSMTPDYVSSWGVWEAVRELLQNTIDQKVGNSDSEVIFEYDNEKLTVGSTNCCLKPKTLLLGATTKTGSNKTIGEFGEGYKLALLVLTRLSYQVIISNGNEVWIPKFEWSDQYDSHVLVIHRYQSQADVEGVFFDITNVSEEDFGTLAEKYLPGISLNCILDEDHLLSKVFVGGLFVCEISELEYGYNFSPDRISLGRDRGMASTFEVSYATARIWEGVNDDKRLYANMAEGKADTEFVRIASSTTNEYVLKRYLSETPSAIPVASDEESRRLIAAGNVVRRVPSALCSLLRRMHKFVFNRSGTPCERLERFSHQFGHRFSQEARKEFSAILETSKSWTAPKPLKQESEAA